MNSVEVPFFILMTLASGDVFIEWSDEELKILAQLVNIDYLPYESSPRAVHALQDTLNEQLPWLPDAYEKFIEWIEPCMDCDEHKDDCTQRLRINGLIALFGDPVKVNPLPVGTFAINPDPEAEATINIMWALVYLSSLDTGIEIAVDIGDDMSEPPNTYMWN